MAITVTMIEEKEFKTKVRGYDPVEVDEFLDAICDEMVEMQNTIHTLRDQLKQRSEGASAPFAPLPVAPAPPPLNAFAPAVQEPAMREEDLIPADLESAQRLLEETQKSCDKVLDEAKKRAEKILKEAEAQLPDPEVDALQEEKDKLRQEIERLREEAQSFRDRFQSMLNDQREILDTQTELF